MTINLFIRKLRVLLLIFYTPILLFPDLVFADTIFLKNRSRLDGVIESENKDSVEINLGYGTATFHKNEIDHIVRSDPKETEAIWQEWGERQKAIEARKPEEEKKWKERQREIERLRHEKEDLKKDQQEYGPKTIAAKAKDGHLLMNAIINDRVRVTLILDSGASTVVLTRRVADQLGLDVDKLKKDRTQVADGRWVDMGLTKLQSVKVQNTELTGSESTKGPGIEAKEIDACVILEESPDKNKMVDGLLGMAFLKNFKFNADYKNGTVTFERLKDEKPEKELTGST